MPPYTDRIKDPYGYLNPPPTVRTGSLGVEDLPTYNSRLARGGTTSPPGTEPTVRSRFEALGPEGQSALFQALLTAGNVMQRQADPEGRHAFTQASTGVLAGTKAYGEIRKAQKKQRLEELTRSKLAAAGEATTPLAQAGALTKTGFEVGDPSLIKTGLDIQGRLTPVPEKARIVSPGQGIVDPTTGVATIPIPKAPSLQAVQPGTSYIDPATGETVLTGRPTPERPRTVSPGQGIYDPATGTTTTPIPKKEPVYNIGGVGYIDNPTYNAALPISEENQRLIPATTAKQTYELELGDRVILYDANTGETKEFAKGAAPKTGAQKAQFIRMQTGRPEDIDAFGVPIEKNMLVIPDPTSPLGVRIIEAPPELEKAGPPAPGRITGAETTQPGQKPTLDKYAKDLRDDNPGRNFSLTEITERYNKLFGEK